MADKHMKAGSPLISIKEMQFKSKVRYRFTSTRMALIRKTDNAKC